MSGAEFDAILNGALRSAARRERNCRLSIPCPSCGSVQVQILMWIDMPAKWRCRHCRHTFIHEPIVAEA